MVLVPIVCQVSENASAAFAQACLSRRPYRYQFSTSWKDGGLYTISLPYFDAVNSAGTQWGLDTLWLGTNGTQDREPVEIIIAGVTEPEFFVPVFGLMQGEVGFQTATKKTIISTLNAESKIPSQSFGYIAGSTASECRHESTKCLQLTEPDKKPGSLILGGYDASKSDDATTLSLDMPSNSNGTMVVFVNAVSISGSSGNRPWSPSNFVIDSTLPQIWAPVDVCRMFEEAFKLDWDDDLMLYTLSDATHNVLLQDNPSVTFTFSSGRQDKQIFNYTLPYSAFDLTLTPPRVNHTTYYFPLRRSLNGINVLG